MTQYEGFEAPLSLGTTTVYPDGSREYQFAEHGAIAVAALQRASVNSVVFEKNSEVYNQLVVTQDFVLFFMRKLILMEIWLRFVMRS